MKNLRAKFLFPLEIKKYFGDKKYFPDLKNFLWRKDLSIFALWKIADIFRV